LLDGVQPVGKRLELGLHIERSRSLLALGRNGDAFVAAAQALRLLAALPAGYRPVAIEADAHLLTGQALLARGDAAAAQAALNRALDLRRGHDAPDSLWVAQAQTALAACHSRLGLRDSAQRLLADARRIHTVLGGTR
jgi:tetratricopeptide (TPR) repeat protein